MIKKYIKIIFIRFKYFINEILKKLKTLIKYKNKELKLSKKNKIFIFLAADYGNIGDVAITYSQKLFLKNFAKDYEIIEVPFKYTYYYISKLKNKIGLDDIITIVGGGNLTDRYDAIEETRRMVIKSFPKNVIISFPQTIEFTNTVEGLESLRRTCRIYSKHENLYIFARELKSYDIMRNTFKDNNVYLVPDIVMSLKESIDFDIKRTEKIGVCLRDDKEKYIKVDVKKLIENNYQKSQLDYISTHIGNDFKYENRENHLFDLLKRIQEKDVFVTDRLHGMIFCFLTQTPCIVFDNDNHKILESYNKWLKDCNYIKLLEEKDAEQINEYIEKMRNIKIKDVNLDKEYKILKEIIKNSIK